MLRPITLILLLVLGSLATAAERVSYFRSDNGVVESKAKLPTDLESAANVIWRRALPPGNSSPCIYGDRIFVTTHDGDELATVGLDAKTGRILWRHPCPGSEIEPFHTVGSPASCTPACDGENVYSFFGSYGLVCHGMQGQLKWSRKLGPYQDEFGCSSSPILVGDKIILNQDHDINSHIIAINKETGATAWKIDRPDATRSYSTPIVWKDGDQTQIIVAGALQLTAYDLKDGKRLWWVNGLARIVNPTPVISDGLIYMASWTPGGDETERISMGPFADAANQWDKNNDGKIAKSELPEGPVLVRFFRIDLDQDGKLDAKEWAKQAGVFERAQNALLAIKPGGKGDVTDTNVVWTYRRGLPNCPSPLVYGGIVYILKNGGILTSLDAKTGDVLKQGRVSGRGNYYSSPVAGDGKIYVASERGVVTVIKSGRDWKIVGEHNFQERIMGTPVIANGQLILRTDDAMYCFGQR